MFNIFKKKNKSKDKDSNILLTNDGIIRIQNHGFNTNTKMLGCGGSGKVRRYVVPNIPKDIEAIIRITKIADTVLEVLTESDFEYIFELHEQCKVKTIQKEHITGDLSFIGEDCIKIQTEVGEKTIIYSSIEEIEKE